MQNALKRLVGRQHGDHLVLGQIYPNLIAFIFNI